MPSRSERPSGELIKAVEEFNRGEWFECHETLEELWVGEKGELRDFYQGVLQIAVALHHWHNGNFKGALILLQKGGDCLLRVSAICLQVDVARLRDDAAAFLETLSAAGEERMGEVDPQLVPRLRLLSGNS
jgi:predicted metal-dependent hydrolase